MHEALIGAFGGIQGIRDEGALASSKVNYLNDRPKLLDDRTKGNFQNFQKSQSQET